MAIFTDLMNKITKKQQEAATKIVENINRKIDVDIEKRNSAIDAWEGFGDFPTRVPLRYVLKIGERNVVAVFPFQGEEELCKVPDIEIGAFVNALMKAGWKLDQDCNTGLQYFRE